MIATNGNCVTENRVGRFSVSQDLLDGASEVRLAALFADMFLSTCTKDPEHKAVVYTAFHPSFPVLELGADVPVMAPTITVEYDREAGCPSFRVQWRVLEVPNDLPITF